MVKEQIYVGNIIKSNILLSNGQIVKISRMDIEEVPKTGQIIYIHWNLSDIVLMKARAYKIYSLIENVDLGGA